MKLAILVGSLAKGGTERVALNLTEYLLGRGHQVTVVTHYRREVEYPLPDGAKRVISDISASETTKNRLVNFVRRFRKLRQIWKSEEPEVILSFIGKNNLMAVMTSRFLSISVVVAVRSTVDTEYPTKLERFLAKQIFRFADGVILQTEENRAFFPSVVRRKAVIMRNPLAPKFFRPRFVGEREKTIVAVGRVDDNKNHRLLIEAFARIANDYPEYQVIIYGEGELRKTLTEEVSALGLADRIKLPGISDQIEEDIYRATVFCLTSGYEGSPNSLIEAMLLGLACIATDCPCGCPAELIAHGENGLLVPVGDAAKLAENLRYLIDNPPLLEKMGRAAHELQTLYEPQAVYERWESYLLGVR